MTPPNGHQKAVEIALKRVADGLHMASKDALREDASTLAQEVSILRQYRDEVEQLRVQLAGCSTAALGYTGPDVARRGDYGWSVAYNDVLGARVKLDAALKLVKQMEVFQALERAEVVLHRFRRDLCRLMPDAPPAGLIEVVDETCDRIALEAGRALEVAQELRHVVQRISIGQWTPDPPQATATVAPKAGS